MNGICLQERPFGLVARAMLDKPSQPSECLEHVLNVNKVIIEDFLCYV